jgi:hypothetical protein
MLAMVGVGYCLFADVSAKSILQHHISEGIQNVCTYGMLLAVLLHWTGAYFSRESFNGTL